MSPAVKRLLLLGRKELDPRTIPNLGLWLRGDVAYTSVSPDVQAAEGETVRRWPDLSGNSRHYGQTTGGNKPTFTTNGVNGRPGLNGDGSDDYMLAEAGLGLLRAVSGATIFVVGKGASGTVATSQIEAAVNVGGSAVSRIATQRTGINTYRVSGRRTDADSAANQDAGVASASPYIHAGLYDFSGAKLYHYLDGALIGTLDPFQTAGSTSNTDSSAMAVFASSAGSFPYPGVLAEVLIWPRLLTASERMAVTTYLSRRYSIAVS